MMCHWGVAKDRTSMQTLNYLAHWIWPQTFEQTFYQFSHSTQTHFLVLQATSLGPLIIKTEELEVWNYFQQLIFNQQIAAPQKEPPGSWSPQNPHCYATVWNNGLPETYVEKHNPVKLSYHIPGCEHLHQKQQSK